MVGGETIADSRRAMLLHESGPPAGLLLPARGRAARTCSSPRDRHTRCPKKGEASYYTIRVGEHVVEAGAWYYPEPLAGAPPLRDLIAFYFNRMDQWFEEDEEIVRPPARPLPPRRRDPRAIAHMRVLARRRAAGREHAARWRCSSRTCRRAGTSRARTSSPSSSRPTPSPAARTRARPATTRSSAESGETVKDLIWYYDDPLAEAVDRIAGLLCFFNERCDIELDGELRGPARSHHLEARGCD